MFWPFIDARGWLEYCPLADFGGVELCEGFELTACVAIAEPVTAHEELSNASELEGCIALVQRGQCDFVVKALRAQRAGAVAVLVGNSPSESSEGGNDSAFVMDAGSPGRHSPEVLSEIQIPVVMVPFNLAAFALQQTRAAALERRGFSLTIKLLGAQQAAWVLEQRERMALAPLQATIKKLDAAQRQEQRERRQRDAAKELRSRLGGLRGSLSSSAVSRRSHLGPAPVSSNDKHSVLGAKSVRSGVAMSDVGSVASEAFTEPLTTRMRRWELESDLFGFTNNNLDDGSTSHSCSSDSNHRRSHSSSSSSVCSVFRGTFQDLRTGRDANEDKLLLEPVGDNQTLLSSTGPVLHPLCPMTTALVVLDVQNQFVLREPGSQQHQHHRDQHRERETSSKTSAKAGRFRYAVENELLPTIQDVLLASRACEGVEIVYSVVESATRDGRERSPTYKRASIHVTRGGFGAQVPMLIAPELDNDFVLPRPGINVFEATNLDFLLRNLSISHIVVVGLNVLDGIGACVLSAIDRGYHVTLVADAILDARVNDAVSRSPWAPAKNMEEPFPPPPAMATAPPPAPASTFTESLNATLIASAQTDESILVPAADEFPNGPHAKAPSLIRGYLWKFPSEGSLNATDIHHEDESYPLKCQRCGVCWVSDVDNEKAHKRVCRSTVVNNIKRRGEREGIACLGPARRVLCEVDGEQAVLQWRFDDESTAWSDRVLMSSIRKAGVALDVPNAFRVVTSDSRRLMFQCRPESTETSGDAIDGTRDDGKQPTECLGVAQWCELFSRLCDLETSEAPTQTMSADHQMEDTSGEGDEDSTLCLELSTEIRRLITDGATESLGQLLDNETGGLLEAPRRDLADADGNSLLLLTLKLCPDAKLPEMIALVVNFGVNPNMANRELETPLMIAAASGSTDIVLQLLAIDGIDVNLPGALGATPLHVAANSGDTSTIELLCQYGADPYIIDENGWSALHYAAACTGGLAAVHFLCELVPELIDAQCTEGNTALHIAAACGCVENVRALLETAANPAVTNSKGQTPYRLALQHDDIQCALAINEYEQPQSTCDHERSTYTVRGEETLDVNAVVGAIMSPLDILRSAGNPEAMENAEKHDAKADGEWIEYVTDEGLPYYYNTITGISSWFKCAVPAPEDSGSWACAATFTHPNALATSTEQTYGRPNTCALVQELPLCLIPMVSPLTSLDDPTAAAKFAAQRQKAREKRHKRLGQQRRETRLEH